ENDGCSPPESTITARSRAPARRSSASASARFSARSRMLSGGRSRVTPAIRPSPATPAPSLLGARPPLPDRRSPRLPPARERAGGRRGMRDAAGGKERAQRIGSLPAHRRDQSAYARAILGRRKLALGAAHFGKPPPPVAGGVQRHAE